MARRKKVPELMGAKEAAEAIGCRQTNLRQIAGLPDPVAVVSATTLWDADEIRDFAERRNARRGEPVAA
jgi:hypothetical protein